MYTAHERRTAPTLLLQRWRYVAAIAVIVLKRWGGWGIGNVFVCACSAAVCALWLCMRGDGRAGRLLVLLHALRPRAAVPVQLLVRWLAVAMQCGNCLRWWCVRVFPSAVILADNY